MTESLFEQITTENIPAPTKEADPQIQVDQQIISRNRDCSGTRLSVGERLLPSRSEPTVAGTWVVAAKAVN